MKTSQESAPPQDFTLSQSLRRIGVHRVILPPGSQSSLPHAESLEEEFVFVVSGQVHAWINGWIHPMGPGDAAGFPAGTGIAHCFLNNSSAPVELIVIGERTKPENKCSFPLNPEMKTASPIWWEESPFHPLGPHQGRPGPVAPHEFGRERPPCIASAQDLPKAPSFHYPGDNETFSRGCRLSTALGLKQLGIWYQILDPGHRSSFPHAHTHEEECAIVLSGTGLVWDHGNPREFLVGDFVEFPAKTGRAHCLINNSEVPLVYLGIGEATDFPDEKIDYPLNPLRTEECLRKGWQWTDLQRPSLGPQSAHPIKRPSRHLAFRKVDSSQAAEVLDILQQAPKYFLNVEGVPPTLPTAIQSIEGVPKLPGPDFYKEFLIIEADHGPVGVIDLHLNHPEKGHAYLGLLLLTEGHQGQGLGRRSYQLLEDYLKRAHLCRKVRLGISQDQNQEAFWQKLGFEPNGRSYTWEGEQKTSRVLEYEKTIP